MAAVRPFRALRPRPDVAPRIAAVPYDVVSRDEAAALAAGNPLSFLHVSRAEIDLPPETDPYADAVYAKAAENFRGLRDWMVQEERPALYFYRLTMGGRAQTGLAGCFSVEEYDRGIVKRHEKTRKDKEDDRTRHIVELRAQTGPVFLVYPHQAAIDRIAAEVCAGTPLYDFVAPDGVAHAIWRAGDTEVARLVEAFAGLPALYIADGHHRAASASRAHGHFQAREDGGPDAEHAWFLAVAFPDDQTRILPYNRVVRDLGGRSPAAFVDEVGRRFRVTPGGPEPERKGQCTMFVGGRWYRVELREAGAAPPADPIQGLDVSVLQERLLGPVLQVLDPRTDKRIDFVGGIRGTGELERLVSSGAAAVAFSMYPVTVSELMAIAEAGSIMPPKSTWFEPKLRDGLLVHLI
jgi:uncharacterized protein (DUF1015 family)